MRGRQHVCAIAPNGDALMLFTLRFAAEVLEPAQVPKAAEASGRKVTAAEVTLARKLIEQMSGPFRPEAFKDTYRADLMRRIQEKIRTKQTHVLTEEPVAAERPKAQVIDLMEALKNSLKKKPRLPCRAAAPLQARAPVRSRARPSPPQVNEACGRAPYTIRQGIIASSSNEYTAHSR